MDRLSEALAKRLRSSPRLGCKVVRIEPDAKATKAMAIYKDQNTRAYFKEEGDAILCTFPLGVLSQIETQP